MALTTRLARQSAQLTSGPVRPRVLIGAAERRAVLGQYAGDTPPAANEFVRTKSRRLQQFTSRRLTP